MTTKHRFAGIEATLDALVRALEPWADDPMLCASKPSFPAPRNNCDCWSCARTRAAQKAIAMARSQDDEKPRTVQFYACVDGVPGCPGDATHPHTPGGHGRSAP